MSKGFQVVKKNNNTFLAMHTDTSNLEHWDIRIIDVGES
jgi:hypothetical protein